MSHIQVDGRRPPNSRRAILADSSATVLYTVEGAILGAVLIKLRLCNKSGSPVSYTVDIFDGTTAFVWEVKSLANDAEADVELDTAIRAGDSLRLTAAANVHWHLEVIELLRDARSGS